MSSSITLSMIVKNEEKHLADCLESVKNVVDEIVIVDTGSTDKTIEIADSFNARIFHFDWTNDFSAARNFALRNSTGKWILYLDADERLDKESAKKIKSLTQTDNNIGYYCTIKSYDSENYRDNTIRYVRFFRNHTEARFEGKVHEQITQSLEKLQFKFIHSDILIHHIGYDITKEEKKQKALRNLKLLIEDYENSKNEYVLFQIAQSKFILENFSEAKNDFIKLINSNKLNKQFKAEVNCYLSQIYFNEFRIAEAENHIRFAIRMNDSQPFYFYLLSKILLRRKNVPDSRNALLKAIELIKRNSKIELFNLQQINVSLSELLYYGLQFAYQFDDLKLKSIFIKELSTSAERRIIELINLLESNLALHKEIPHAYLNSINKLNLSFILFLASRNQNSDFNYKLLQELYRKFPDNTEVIKQYALVKDSFNNTDEAIKIFESNFDIINNDPSSLLYLAMLYLKKDKPNSALKIFELIENKFSNYDDITLKVKTIKEKISDKILS